MFCQRNPWLDGSATQIAAMPANPRVSILGLGAVVGNGTPAAWLHLQIGCALARHAKKKGAKIDAITR
jgi:hypothetical protein